MATKVDDYQTLRPQGLHSRAVRMAKVFDDPEATLKLVGALSPYGTVATYGNGSSPDPSSLTVPWYLDEPPSALLVQNRNWIAAAHEAFDVDIVEPIRCVVNLNPPGPAGVPHLDLPVFRGFAQPEIPIWLLMAMSHSRLFFDWLVPLASGVAWFWKGEGGEFEYWLDGLAHTSLAERSPLWNCGVMSSNEIMWHRVGAIGPAARRAALSQGVPVMSRMHRTDSGWEIRHDESCIAAFAAEEVRISFVWKAYVFKSEEHRASFKDRAYDLNPDRVVDIFNEDLAARGIAARRPADPITDGTWRTLLEQTYRPPD